MFVPNETVSTTPIPAVSDPVPQSDVRPPPPSADVFLFDRRNRRYLDQRGGRVYLQAADTPFIVQIIILIFAVFMSFVAIQGGVTLFRWAITKSSGTVTQAHVVDKRISRGKSTSYTVVYAFTVDDVRYQVSQLVDSSVYAKANEIVEVTYWPSDPNMARLSGDYEVGNMALNGLFQLFCPGVFVAIMLTIMVAGFRGWRKLVTTQRQLREEGHLIYGEVISVRGKSVPKQGYKVSVKYIFRTPDVDGRWVTRSQQRPLNWMRSKSLPGKGTPIAVLYLNDKNVEML